MSAAGIQDWQTHWIEVPQHTTSAHQLGYLFLELRQSGRGRLHVLSAALTESLFVTWLFRQGTGRPARDTQLNYGLSSIQYLGDGHPPAQRARLRDSQRWRPRRWQFLTKRWCFFVVTISTYITYHQSVGKAVFRDLRRSTYWTPIADILLPKPHQSANSCQTGETRCMWPVVRPYSLRNALEFQFRLLVSHPILNILSFSLASSTAFILSIGVASIVGGCSRECFSSSRACILLMSVLFLLFVLHLYCISILREGNN